MMRENQGGMWSNQVQEVVQLINPMKNEGTGWAPLELWNGSLAQRKVDQQ